MGLKPKVSSSNSPIPWASRNRTIMGLKQRASHFRYLRWSWSQSNHYGIETSSHPAHLLSTSKSQSNHYGIETILLQSLIPLHTAVAIEPLWDWNEDLEEIKSRLRRVAIEPLWDWNSMLDALKDFFMTSQSNHYGIETSYFVLVHCYRYSSRNRTIMGLKQIAANFSIFSIFVAIEPLWDWNIKTAFIEGEVLASQSNHYGIETSLWLLLFLLPSWSQSNHYGIETIHSNFLPRPSLGRNRTIMGLKR